MTASRSVVHTSLLRNSLLHRLQVDGYEERPHMDMYVHAKEPVHAKINTNIETTSLSALKCRTSSRRLSERVV